MPCRRVLSVLLVVSLVVGHVATLQLIAWTGMLIARTQTMSWSAAVTSTFSNQQPCPLCRVVRALQGSERSDATAPAPGPKAPMKPAKMRSDLAVSDGQPALPSLPLVQAWQWPRPASVVLDPNVLGPEPPPPRRAGLVIAG